MNDNLLEAIGVSVPFDTLVLASHSPDRDSREQENRLSVGQLKEVTITAQQVLYGIKYNEYDNPERYEHIWPITDEQLQRLKDEVRMRGIFNEM